MTPYKHRENPASNELTRRVLYTINTRRPLKKPVKMTDKEPCDDFIF